MKRILATKRELELEEEKKRRATSVEEATKEKAWWLNPRHSLFFAFYFDPKSPSFLQATQSGVRAGFAEEYSSQLLSTMPKWLVAKFAAVNPLLDKAVRNLGDMLDLPSQTQAIGAFGPLFKKKGKKKTNEPIMVYNPSLLKIKADTSEFVAERIGRDTWAPKVADNNNVFNVVLFANDQRTKIAKRIIRGGSARDTASAPKAD